MKNNLVSRYRSSEMMSPQQFRPLKQITAIDNSKETWQEGRLILNALIT